MLIIEIVVVCLVGLVALLGIVGLLLPRRWRVERSSVMSAPPSSIFPLVNDFERGWKQWNPFVEPGMTITYEGSKEGVGAVSKWLHGREAGRNEITESSPTKGIAFSISMNNGFNMSARIGFETQGPATKVTWSDEGEIGNPFFRIMVVLMKGMIGKKLDQGLSNMKAIVEKAPARVA